MRSRTLLLIALAGIAGAVSLSVWANPLQIPPVRYPNVPTQGQAAKDFVPKGWKLEDQVRGDLNGDGRADRVLLLYDNDPHNVVTHSGTGENPTKATTIGHGA